MAFCSAADIYGSTQKAVNVNNKSSASLASGSSLLSHQPPSSDDDAQVGQQPVAG